ncbi:MAG: hypothetical protein M3P85_16235 [Actinomycetota bacterium]|nr:hypothetical protein [Actinomycetota bacterium]
MVTHEAAAALHGLILFPPGPVMLTVVHGDHERKSRLWRVHQSRDLRPAHVTIVDGLPVSTVPRTFVDLAAVAGKERVVARGRPPELDLSVGGGAGVVRRAAPAGQARPKRLGQLLSSRGPGYVPPESVLERRLLKVLRDSPIPPLPFGSSCCRGGSR